MYTTINYKVDKLHAVLKLMFELINIFKNKDIEIVGKWVTFEMSRRLNK